jgi:hypothetical protein
MALELNLAYQGSDDKMSIVVTDNTGAYNPVTNPGGYGGVNPSAGDFSNFNISCYMPDPVTLLPQPIPVVIDAYSALPSVSNGTFDLTSLLLTGSATAVLIDGWYQFIVSADYDTGITEGTATTTNNLILFAIVDCCITNMTVKELDCGCSGASTKIAKLEKANLMLDQLRKRVVNGVIVDSPIDQCGQYNEGVNFLQIAQDICDSSECKGCGGCG